MSENPDANTSWTSIFALTFDLTFRFFRCNLVSVLFPMLHRGITLMTMVTAWAPPCLWNGDDKIIPWENFMKDIYIYIYI
jgi:hypothetical protein